MKSSLGPRRTPWPQKIRSSGARRVVSRVERRKQLGRAFLAGADVAVRIGAAAALSCALGWGARAAAKNVLHGDAFAIRSVRIEGARHAGEADLLARSGLAVGNNLFAIDSAKAAKAVAQHPWVASVRVRRELPSVITLQIREHEAEALVEMGALYAADRDGRLFKRATRGDGLDLPVLTGIKREKWQRERADSERNLSLALDLVASWRAQGLPLAGLSEVRVDEDGGLTLFAQDRRGDGDLLEVRMGREAFGPRLTRLGQIRAALARRRERAVRVQLDLAKAGGAGWAAAQTVSE
jgi:cell division protein FtsQ